MVTASGMTEFAVTPPARPHTEWGVYGPRAGKFTGKHTAVPPPMVLYFRGTKHNGLFSLSPALREQALRAPEKYLAVVDMTADDPLEWVAVALSRTSAKVSARATLRQWIRSHANPQTRRRLGETVSYWADGCEPERWHLHTSDEQDRDVLWRYCYALMYSDVAKRMVGFVPFPSVDPTDGSTFTALPPPSDRTVDIEGLGKAWAAFYQSPACAAIRSTWSHQLPRVVGGYRWRRCVMTAGPISIDLYTHYIPPETPTIVPELTAADFPPRKIKVTHRRCDVIPSFSIEPVYTKMVGRFLGALALDNADTLSLTPKTEKRPLLAEASEPGMVLFGNRAKKVDPALHDLATALFRMRMVVFLDQYFAREIRVGEDDDDRWEDVKTWVFTTIIEIYLKNAKPSSPKWTVAGGCTLYPPVIFDNFSYSVRNTSGEILRCQFQVIDAHCDPDHLVTCDVDVDTIQSYCARVRKFRRFNAPIYTEPVGPDIGLAGAKLVGRARHVRREPGCVWSVKFVREAVFSEKAFSRDRAEAIKGGERKRSR